MDDRQNLVSAMNLMTYSPRHSISSGKNAHVNDGFLHVWRREIVAPYKLYPDGAMHGALVEGNYYVKYLTWEEAEGNSIDRATLDKLLWRGYD